MKIPEFENDWDEIIPKLFAMDGKLQKTIVDVSEQYADHECYPPEADIFNAFKYTSYADTRVVILGQDPYINPGQAHGLAFSVLPGADIPPSLMNVFVELKNELGCQVPNNGYLVPWAQQGVLLLNTVLTVDKGVSHSHRKLGWQRFTDQIISILANDYSKKLVFMLWGNDAKEKAELIPEGSHLVLKAAHPSPLAGGKFFGCNHFIDCNNYLYEVSNSSINWQIPDIERK